MDIYRQCRKSVKAKLKIYGSDSLAQCIEPYLCMMFRHDVLDARFVEKRGLNDTICCGCQRFVTQQLHLEFMDFSFYYLTYVCDRCGSTVSCVDFESFHHFYHNRLESTVIRPIVLYYVRCQFETWLNDFLIADLVDLVGLYLYIEPIDIDVDRQPHKKRKLK